MILIPFVPGTFASTIEYILRRFTVEANTNIPLLAPMDDGSMHNIIKLQHIEESIDLVDSIKKYRGTNTILTPIYPFKDMHVPETFEILNNIELSPEDKSIVIFVENREMAEITMLFQYYKIAIGLNKTLDIFFNEVTSRKNLSRWNNHDVLEQWELREWFSLFYDGWIQEWLDTKPYISDRHFQISSSEILMNPHEAVNKIIKYCGYSKNDEEQLGKFIDVWQQKQQYVLDEYNCINQFVKSTIDNIDYTMNHCSIIAESIIQQKLRKYGYEIRCWKLNEFPTQAQELHKLLEKA